MRKQKPAAEGRLARAVAIVMLTVLLSCGFIPSAIRISGGTSGAVIRCCRQPASVYALQQEGLQISLLRFRADDPQLLCESGASASPEGLRVPAADLEKVVTTTIADRLRNQK